MRMRTLLALAVATTWVIFWTSLPARGQDSPAKTDGEKAAEPPPKHGLEKADDAAKAVYETIRKRMSAVSAANVTNIRSQKGFGLKVGNDIAPMLETMLWGYRYSGNVRWLDRFVEVMTALEKLLVEDPDGNLGWYSAPSSRMFGESWPPRWPDDSSRMAWQHAEARVIAACADFELLVRDDAELKDKFLDTAQRWTKLAETKLLPKWKDDYTEISQDRAVVTWPSHVFAEGKKEWLPFPGNPDGKIGLTLPHAAISEIILRDLKLWQLRGDNAYRTRAAKLLRWQKSCLRFYRGGPINQYGLYSGKPDTSVYFWHTWDPAGDWDFRSEGGAAFGMYMAVEPSKYGRDIEAFVEAYHTGTVIDRQDIERLVQTQLKKMLTGSPEKPTWKDQRGERPGMLWPQLAEFDEQLDALLKAAPEAATADFGSALRFLQDRPNWGHWARRKKGQADEIAWGKTHEDFRTEVEELMKLHPPPDPRKPKG